MGGNCAKAKFTDHLDLRNEKTKRDYYLNVTNNNNKANDPEQGEVGHANYDIVEQRLVGYSHI